MAPSCFALQVPGLQVPVGTRLQTALVSLERSHFRSNMPTRLYDRFFFCKVKTSMAMAGPAVVAPTALLYI